MPTASQPHRYPSVMPTALLFDGRHHAAVRHFEARYDKPIANIVCRRLSRASARRRREHGPPTARRAAQRRARRCRGTKRSKRGKSKGERRRRRENPSAERLCPVCRAVPLHVLSELHRVQPVARRWPSEAIGTALSCYLHSAEHQRRLRPDAAARHAVSFLPGHPGANFLLSGNEGRHVSDLRARWER